MLNNLVISGDVNGTRNSKSGTSTRFTMWSTWILVYTRSTRNKFSRKSMSYEKLLLTISFGRQNDRRKKALLSLIAFHLYFGVNRNSRLQVTTQYVDVQNMCLYL